jgi:hypothetical protein
MRNLEILVIVALYQEEIRPMHHVLDLWICNYFSLIFIIYLFRNMIFSSSAGDGFLFDASLRHGSLNPDVTKSEFFRALLAFYAGK